MEHDSSGTRPPRRHSGEWEGISHSDAQLRPAPAHFLIEQLSFSTIIVTEKSKNFLSYLREAIQKLQSRKCFFAKNLPIKSLCYFSFQTSLLVLKRVQKYCQFFVCFKFAKFRSSLERNLSKKLSRVSRLFTSSQYKEMVDSSITIFIFSFYLRKKHIYFSLGLFPHLAFLPTHLSFWQLSSVDHFKL